MSEPGEAIEDRDWEAEARPMGWHPLDEFRGKPEDWVDAETFVRRGETQLPIMRENNRKLATRARRAEDDNAELRQQMSEMRDSLTTMRTMMERGQEVGYQRAKAEFEAQMRQAVRNGDEASFDKIQGEMAKLDEAHEKITAPAPKADPKPPAKVPGPPEFQAWFDENKTWILADPVLKNAAEKASKELDESDEPLAPDQYWDTVTAMVQQKYPRRFAAATGQTVPTEPPPAPPHNGGSQLRRASPVLSPSGGAPALSKKSGIEAIADIADPEERKLARSAFNSIRRGIPDYTEAEYIKVYVNPNADVIGDFQQRRVKANG